MVLIVLLTMMVVLIPVLHVLNRRYVQQIAVLFGAGQLALLALSGRIDQQLSSMLVDGMNHVCSAVCSLVLNKISYLLLNLC
ncbi:MAG TPA: hypothetical protein PLA16_03445 [Chitinophagales bacterium]|nr:hypothetical protein [Chitinophagales bacterium]HQD13527.1 hypothetical protein [Chitinophagales bacterium]